MTKKFVVIGAGQLGSQFLRDYPAMIGLSYPDIDITKPSNDQKIAALKPDVIINCAAYTAVDKAEAEIEAARALNASAPARLAELAKNLNALFVHISTDYVFDGSNTDPYTEESPTQPVNA